MSVDMIAFTNVGAAHVRTADCPGQSHVVATWKDETAVDPLGGLTEGMCYQVDGRLEAGNWSVWNVDGFTEALFGSIGALTKEGAIVQAPDGHWPFERLPRLFLLEETVIGPEPASELSADFDALGQELAGRPELANEDYKGYLDTLALGFRHAQPHGLVLFI
jgi:hypothetical protein